MSKWKPLEVTSILDFITFLHVSVAHKHMHTYIHTYIHILMLLSQAHKCACDDDHGNVDDDDSDDETSLV